jgi:trimethylamine:corrinoid methyltransferase-like protein
MCSLLACLTEKVKPTIYRRIPLSFGFKTMIGARGMCILEGFLGACLAGQVARVYIVPWHQQNGCSHLQVKDTHE